MNGSIPQTRKVLLDECWIQVALFIDIWNPRSILVTCTHTASIRAAPFWCWHWTWGNSARARMTITEVLCTLRWASWQMSSRCSYTWPQHSKEHFTAALLSIQSGKGQGLGNEFSMRVFKMSPLKGYCINLLQCSEAVFESTESSQFMSYTWNPTCPILGVAYWHDRLVNECAPCQAHCCCLDDRKNWYSFRKVFRAGAVQLQMSRTLHYCTCVFLATAVNAPLLRTFKARQHTRPLRSNSIESD